MRFGKGGEDLVADAVDERQLWVDLPAILREEARLPAAVVGRGDVEVAGLAGKSRGSLPEWLFEDIRWRGCSSLPARRFSDDICTGWQN